MTAIRAPAFLLLAAATLCGACQHRGESEALQPAEAPIHDDRAVTPTDSASPTTTPNPSPPTASAAPSGTTRASEAPESGSSADSDGAVQSSAAHERFGGEYGARDNGANASGSGGGAGNKKGSDSRMLSPGGSKVH